MSRIALSAVVWPARMSRLGLQAVARVLPLTYATEKTYWASP